VENSENIAFKTGAIYVLNKVQEWIADGKSLSDIEGEVIKMVEKAFRGLEKLF